MTFAGSIFLIAVGAILRFATHFHLKGLDLQTVGLIASSPPGGKALGRSIRFATP
jgi:hypothetical protein